MGKVLTQFDAMRLIERAFCYCNYESEPARAAAAAATFSSLWFQGFDHKWIKTDFLHMLYGEYAFGDGNGAEWHSVPRFDIDWHLDAVGNFGIVRKDERGGYEWTVITPDDRNIIATRKELTFPAAMCIAELYMMKDEEHTYRTIPEEYSDVWSYAFKKPNVIQYTGVEPDETKM